MPLPAEVLAATLRADPGRPRVTAYDDGTGERIELSAKVLATWVAKAANLLQDDADAGMPPPPGVAVLARPLLMSSVPAAAAIAAAAIDLGARLGAAGQ